MKSPLMRRAVPLLVAATVLAGTSACGIGDRIAGTRPIPVEATTGAPLDVRTATAIVNRVLGEAAAAPTDASAAAQTRRAETMAASALSTANAAAALGERTTSPESVVVPDEAEVLAISTGHAWPRTILATTLDEQASTRHLHFLVSTAANRPFVLAASVPMAPRAELPALAPITDGAAAVGSVMQSDPEAFAVITAYAKALAHPKPQKSPLVDTTDPLATDLRANAAAQSKALGALATLTQTHVPAPGEAGRSFGFELADGGSVVFGQLVRTDTVALRPQAKEVVLPADIARIVKKPKVTKSVTIRTLENLILVIPPSGPARVIGASEQRLDARGS